MCKLSPFSVSHLPKSPNFLPLLHSPDKHMYVITYFYMVYFLEFIYVYTHK